MEQYPHNDKLMHTVGEVQNAIPTLNHKTHIGCGWSMHYSHMGMKK